MFLAGLLPRPPLFFTPNHQSTCASVCKVSVCPFTSRTKTVCMAPLRWSAGPAATTPRAKTTPRWKANEQNFLGKAKKPEPWPKRTHLNQIPLKKTMEKRKRKRRRPIAPFSSEPSYRGIELCTRSRRVGLSQPRNASMQEEYCLFFPKKMFDIYFPSKNMPLKSSISNNKRTSLPTGRTWPRWPAVPHPSPLRSCHCTRHLCTRCLAPKTKAFKTLANRKMDQILDVSTPENHLQAYPEKEKMLSKKRLFASQDLQQLVFFVHPDARHCLHALRHPNSWLWCELPPWQQRKCWDSNCALQSAPFFQLLLWKGLCIWTWTIERICLSLKNHQSSYLWWEIEPQILQAKLFHIPIGFSSASLCSCWVGPQIHPCPSRIHTGSRAFVGPRKCSQRFRSNCSSTSFAKRSTQRILGVSFGGAFVRLVVALLIFRVVLLGISTCFLGSLSNHIL